MAVIEVNEVVFKLGENPGEKARIYTTKGEPAGTLCRSQTGDRVVFLVAAISDAVQGAPIISFTDVALKEILGRLAQENGTK